ncbi:protein-export chaperone SecB [Natronospirillum operosum]|uniref:Protein-export protein SecB n=1 Tax=Natronospirillum operosum TaxID=2759953 RepID=A0A4Z0W8M3_9GAMM|nr:protein-export chaperone SecB [Natronospirillum operosum]TGG92358.1 protein-export chaperone SecB [Natronospirillum operosum]
MAEEQPKTRFGIQRLFTRNTSFESPNAPQIFREQWKPQIKVDLNTKSTKLADDAYEVVIRVTVTAKLEEKTAFLAEVEQGCVASIAGFDDKQLDQMLGAYVPSLLFPYARETVDNMVVKGSFPPVMLAPVNFDALHKQQKEKQATGGNAEAAH